MAVIVIFFPLFVVRSSVRLSVHAANMSDAVIQADMMDSVLILMVMSALECFGDLECSVVRRVEVVDVAGFFALCESAFACDFKMVNGRVYISPRSPFGKFFHVILCFLKQRYVCFG